MADGPTCRSNESKLLVKQVGGDGKPEPVTQEKLFLVVKL